MPALIYRTIKRQLRRAWKIAAIKIIWIFNLLRLKVALSHTFCSSINSAAASEDQSLIQDTAAYSVFISFKNALPPDSYIGCYKGWE